MSVAPIAQLVAVLTNHAAIVSQLPAIDGLRASWLDQSGSVAIRRKGPTGRGLKLLVPQRENARSDLRNPIAAAIERSPDSQPSMLELCSDDISDGGNALANGAGK